MRNCYHAIDRSKEINSAVIPIIRPGNPAASLNNRGKPYILVFLFPLHIKVKTEASLLPFTLIKP